MDVTALLAQNTLQYIVISKVGCWLKIEINDRVENVTCKEYAQWNHYNK